MAHQLPLEEPDKEKVEARKIFWEIIKWPYQSIFYLDQDILKKREFYNLVLSLSYSEKDAIDDYAIRNISRRDYEHIHKKFNQVRKKFVQLSRKKKTPDDKMHEKIKTLGYVNN
jgi:hypothetical protein